MKCKFILILSLIISASSIDAHPGGNMIVVGEHVIWSYISPIDDTEHHACVMIWSPRTKPRVILKSQFSASDYMFYNDEDQIYIIEQRYIQQDDHFEIRVLKMKVGENPKEIWGWFVDPWRIGDSGFIMKSDEEIVFGRYPHIQSIKKGAAPKKYFEFDAEIRRIRAVQNDQILMVGDDTCWLVKHDGTVLKSWESLIDPKIKNAPLDINQIFDMDYANDELLLAYWGRRTFDIVGKHGSNKTILQLSDPLTPHWVAFYKNAKLLFASKLVFDGSTPKPNLILYESKDQQQEIWTY